MNVIDTLLLSIPALSLLSIEALGFHVKIFFLFCLLLGFFRLRMDDKQDLKYFSGSGKTEPALYAQELILRKKGGKGNDLFLDPLVAFASLDDFDYTPGKSIIFKQLLKEKKNVITPYCIDDEKRQIIFVETERGFDPSKHGLYFQAQRKHAIKLYTVPYDVYHSVINALDEDMTSTKNVVLLYNTCKSGSRLFNQCYRNLTQGQNISKPDIFTSLANIASESYGTRNSEIIALARSSAKLLCYLHRHRHPERKDLCLSFRSQVINIADLIQKAIPDSKAIFLYRTALDVIDSQCAMFIKDSLSYQLIRLFGLDVIYLYYFSNLSDHMWKIMPLMKDTRRFPPSSYEHLGFISIFAMSWLSVMHKAIEAIEAETISVAIRYDDLIQEKDRLVWKALLDINYPSAKIPKQFCRIQRKCRSEKIEKMRTSNGYLCLSDKDVFDIKMLVSCHDIGTPDYFISRTLYLY